MAKIHIGLMSPELFQSGISRTVTRARSIRSQVATGFSDGTDPGESIGDMADELHFLFEGITGAVREVHAHCGCSHPLTPAHAVDIPLDAFDYIPIT